MPRSSSNDALIAQAAELVRQADGLIVAAGAGMGVDSGLPDFRGASGFWNAYPALGRAQIEFHRIASPDAFRCMPQTAWGFYGHRLNLYRQTMPHDGYALLRRWALSKPLGCKVFTSNVDGQFQKAGFGAHDVHECHGSIHHLQCVNVCCDAIWSADGFRPEVDEYACKLLNEPPTCPACGGLARPNILMFHDIEWCEHREQNQAAMWEPWLSQTQRPLVVELGAGTAIPSVRHFSQRVISDWHGRLIRINPLEADVPTRLDIGLRTRALVALQAMAAYLTCNGN